MLGLRVASTTLATGLGLSLVPYPRPCRMGLEPRSEAPLCALQLLAPSFRVVLAEAAGLRRLLDLSIVLPWPSVRFQVHLLCTASRQQVVFCAWRLLLRVRLRPLPDDSLGALGLPARLLWSSLRQWACESSSLSAWSFPFGGLPPFSCLFLSWRPCRSRSLIPSLAPSWWWPCLLLRWALLTLSGYVLSVPLRLFFTSVSLVDPVGRSCRIVAPLAPCLCWWFQSLVRVSLLRRGVSPCVWFRRNPWGVAVAPPISPYTGPGWSPPICRVPLELRSVFHILLRDVPHVFMAIILSVSLTHACPWLVITIGWCSLDTCKMSDWVDLLSPSSLFQDSVICADL